MPVRPDRWTARQRIFASNSPPSNNEAAVVAIVLAVCVLLACTWGPVAHKNQLKRKKAEYEYIHSIGPEKVWEENQ